ncbi:MAG: glycoside hydrolase family 13 protein [Clostridium sp.]|uniref:glycoside hydrolase family 13 protein n=1 Tax=Clostridium sp. DSM 8431 TaxID=1761781 RepID=UPI0008E864D8|nr:glycoside hydrolase family 13 protein [Clostridium sp. DSM 8431]MCR4943178.1 glycoside hydrolase family 13 protein [Clostridium sp.]SFU70714.1 Glycosidase [Clostridium sp. DSM 8431]
MEELRIIHDSQKMNYRKPFGAVESGEKVKIALYINRDTEVILQIIKSDGLIRDINMDKEYLNDGSFKYFAEVDTSDYIGLLEYYFVIIQGYDRVYYGNNDERLGGIGQVYNYNPIPYQITVYEKSIVPDWYKEGVIYQIFVDRFCNGNKDGKVLQPKKNSFIYGDWSDKPMYIKDTLGRIARWDFYGGNLEGVISKLDYLKELGISIIYLNPIFEASSCHKYDTGDYEKIDEMFGTKETFERLCSMAKEKGMRIILDGVFSHTGSDSKYFNKFNNYEEVGAYQSTESKYYKWYRFQHYPDKYECWWGIDNQPNVEELEPSYADYIVNGENSIIERWMKSGANGWRLDVADELPDDFIKMIKKKMKEVKEDSVLIGEVWEDASNKVSYSQKREYFYGKELDSVTNYPFRESFINFIKGYIKSDKFKKIILSLYENYPRENFYACMNVLGTHDTERIFTILDERVELFKLIIGLQMTLPGVPIVYYGDEAGVTGGKDPDNRKTYPWGNENIDILDYYRLLIGIRNREKALKKGNLKFYDTDLDVCMYERQFENEIVLIAVNTSGENKTLNNISLKGKYFDLLNRSREMTELEDNGTLILKKFEVKILKIYIG